MNVQREERRQSPGFIKSIAPPSQATVDARRLIVDELNRVGLSSALGDFRVKRELNLTDYLLAGGDPELLKSLYEPKDLEEAKRWVNIENRRLETGSRKAGRVRDIEEAGAMEAQASGLEAAKKSVRIEPFEESFKTLLISEDLEGEWIKYLELKSLEVQVRDLLRKGTKTEEAQAELNLLSQRQFGSSLDIVRIVGAGGGSLLRSLEVNPEVTEATIRVFSTLSKEIPEEVPSLETASGGRLSQVLGAIDRGLERGAVKLSGGLGTGPEISESTIRKEFLAEASRFASTGSLNLRTALDAGVSGDDLETLGFDPGTIFVLKKGTPEGAPGAPPRVTGVPTIETLERRDKLLNSIQRELDFQRGFRGGVSPSDPEIVQSTFFVTKEQHKQVSLTGLRKGIESGATSVDEGWKALEDINKLEIAKVPVGQEAYMIPGYGTYLSYQDMRKDPGIVNLGFFLLSATGDVLLFTGVGFAFKVVRFPFATAKNFTKVSIAEARALGRLVPRDVRAVATIGAQRGITTLRAEARPLATGVRTGIQAGKVGSKVAAEASRIVVRGGKAIARAVPEIIPTAGRTAREIGPTLGRARASVGQTLSTTQARVKAFPTQIKSGIGQVRAKGSAAVGRTTAQTRETLGQVTSKLRGAEEAITRLPSRALEGVSGGVRLVKGKAIGGVQSGVSRVRAVKAEAGALVSGGRTSVGEGISRVRGGIRAGIAGVEQVPGKIKTKVTTTVGKAKAVVSPIPGQIKTTVGTTLKQIATKAGEVTTTVRKSPKKAATSFREAAKRTQASGALKAQDTRDRLRATLQGLQIGLTSTGSRLMGLPGRGFGSARSGVSRFSKRISTRTGKKITSVKSTFKDVTSSLRGAGTKVVRIPGQIRSRIVDTFRVGKGLPPRGVSRIGAEASSIRTGARQRLVSLRSRAGGIRDTVLARFREGKTSVIDTGKAVKELPKRGLTRIGAEASRLNLSARARIGSGSKRLKDSATRIRESAFSKLRTGKSTVRRIISGGLEVPGRVSSRVSRTARDIKGLPELGLRRLGSEASRIQLQAKSKIGTGFGRLSRASVKAGQDITTRIGNLKSAIGALPEKFQSGAIALRSNIGQTPSRIGRLSTRSGRKGLKSLSAARVGAFKGGRALGLALGRSSTRVGRAAVRAPKRITSRLQSEASRLEAKVMAGDTKLRIPGELKRVASKIVRRDPGVEGISRRVSKIVTSSSSEASKVKKLGKVLPSVSKEDRLALVRKYQNLTPSHVRVLESQRLRLQPEISVPEKAIVRRAARIEALAESTGKIRLKAFQRSSRQLRGLGTGSRRGRQPAARLAQSKSQQEASRLSRFKALRDFSKETTSKGRKYTPEDPPASRPPSEGPSKPPSGPRSGTGPGSTSGPRSGTGPDSSFGGLESGLSRRSTSGSGTTSRPKNLGGQATAVKPEGSRILGMLKLDEIGALGKRLRQMVSVKPPTKTPHRTPTRKPLHSPFRSTLLTLFRQ